MYFVQPNRKMACNFTFSLLCSLTLTFLLLNAVLADKKDGSKDKVEEKDKWKKKDIRDYSDADMERLFDQWEDTDEDELEEDELPEWKREPPKVDMSKIDINDPEGMLKMTKKGRSLMIFATVSGNPTKQETEKVTQIWQGSLFNANMETQRYVVSDSRVIFMVKDGALAWDIKKFLIDQDRCEEVTIEGKSYPGKGATGKSSGDSDRKTSKKEEQKKKKKEKKDGSDKTKDKAKKVMDNRTERDEL